MKSCRRERVMVADPEPVAAQAVGVAHSKNRKFIPTYVIALPDAEARRRNMTSRLAAVGLPFTFVDALYGRTVPIPDHIDGARVLRSLFKTESGLGCTVSHRLMHRM